MIYTENTETQVIAVPITQGVLAMHFGHCAEFSFVHANPATGKVSKTTTLAAPEHQPGLLPRWLSDHGANVIIAGGMGSRAQKLFADNGIRVITGAPALPPEELVKRHLEGALETGANVCDH